MADVDVIVLGAGIAGVTTALNLRQQGASVALIDKGHPGDETSGANAGIVAGNGLCPAQMPSGLMVWLDLLMKQSAGFNFEVKTLIKLAPWMRAYLSNTSASALQAHVRAIAPLRAAARKEHRRLARIAKAERFYKKSGWLQLYRSEAGFARAERERHYARIYGIDYQTLRGGEIHEVEPAIRSERSFGVYWPECDSISDPAGLTEALWREFIQSGGLFLNGEAERLTLRRRHWVVQTPRTEVRATDVVAALGPWTAGFAAQRGERFPVAFGRGYGLNYRPRSGATLSRPVTDMDHGFTLSPMEQGIRLTSGVDVVGLEAEANLNSLQRAQNRATEIFPLGQELPLPRVMGHRDCLPDFLPLAGASAQNRGLWYNFGYGGSGMALAPGCSRLLAERIAGSGETALLQPLAPLRFS